MNHRAISIVAACLAVLSISTSAVAYDFVGSFAKQAINSVTKASYTPGIPAGPEMSVVKGAQNTNCPQFQAFGYPIPFDEKVVHRGFYTCRAGYASMYDPATKTPRWVAEHIKGSALEGSANRKQVRFSEDPQLPHGVSATLNDYSRSGYDKGHMAPAADYRSSQESMNQTFLLSNIVPQNPVHNQGIWANLEAAIREMVGRWSDLYVITGPIYDAASTKIGSGVAVPSALFKVVIDRKRQEMTAFIIPNRPDVGDDPAKYQVRVRDVEHATGMDFNPALSRREADRVEAAGGDWIIPKVRLKFRD